MKVGSLVWAGESMGMLMYLGSPGFYGKTWYVLIDGDLDVCHEIDLDVIQ